ncbi:MAG: response regulator transcription factor [Candidatus Glassbacteria bacterium]|nr:response regulator transcription factor [Candidatus Glassbacteria bacterium]
MVLVAQGENELAGEVRAALDGLDYEVLHPTATDGKSLREIEQVDLFLLVAARVRGLEKLAVTLSDDDLLKSVPRLVITSDKALEKFDYCRLADEILVTPFTSVELTARLRMISWRLFKVDPSNRVTADELVINLATYEVTLDGSPVDLTFKEYELLRYLATHRRRVHSRRELLSRVWGEDYYGGARTVDVHIRRIRAKIEQRGRQYIQTVRGVGYRFIG